MPLPISLPSCPTASTPFSAACATPLLSSNKESTMPSVKVEAITETVAPTASPTAAPTTFPGPGTTVPIANPTARPVAVADTFDTLACKPDSPDFISAYIPTPVPTTAKAAELPLATLPAAFTVFVCFVTSAASDTAGSTISSVNHDTLGAASYCLATSLNRAPS